MTPPFTPPDHPSATPPDPRADRFERLASALRMATMVVAALAAIGLVLPSDAGRVPASVLVAVLILTPLARVGWFAQRWLRRGDRRFAGVALAVAASVLVGALLA